MSIEHSYGIMRKHFSSVLSSSFMKIEEEVFLNGVKKVSSNSVPKNAIVFSLHAFYSIKVNGDSSLSLKKKIAPHDTTRIVFNQK